MTLALMAASLSIAVEADLAAEVVAARDWAHRKRLRCSSWTPTVNRRKPVKVG